MRGLRSCLWTVLAGATFGLAGPSAARQAGVPGARSVRTGVEAGVPGARSVRTGVEAGVPGARSVRTGVEAGVPGARPLPRIDFTYQIRPLLSDRCFRCHGPDAGKRKAKLRLDTREGILKKLDDAGKGWAVVKPGDPDKSELDPPHLHGRRRRQDAAARVASGAVGGRQGVAQAMGRRGGGLPAALVARAGPRGRRAEAQ